MSDGPSWTLHREPFLLYCRTPLLVLPPRPSTHRTLAHYCSWGESGLVGTRNQWTYQKGSYQYLGLKPYYICILRKRWQQMDGSSGTEGQKPLCLYFYSYGPSLKSLSLGRPKHKDFKNPLVTLLRYQFKQVSCKKKQNKTLQDNQGNGSRQ